MFRMASARRILTCLRNQGIVTKFILKAYPQTHVWVCVLPPFLFSREVRDRKPTLTTITHILQGGMIMITGSGVDALNKALVKFMQTVTDPKAAVLPTYNFFLGQVSRAVHIGTESPNWISNRAIVFLVLRGRRASHYSFSTTTRRHRRVYSTTSSPFHTSQRTSRPGRLWIS